MARIYISAPDVGPLEESHVLDALRSGWVAPLGPHLDRFERDVAERCGRVHAVGLSSGTAALHLALLELGAGPGTVVIVPTMTFAATANAVVYTGASPVFVDCDPATGNVDPNLLEHALGALRAEGEHVSAVVPVDLLGRCADYWPVLAVCEEFGVQVLEDAAEALGSSYDGRPAGSFGTASVISFNGNKIITTSGGGMLVTDDAGLAERVRHLSTQARRPAPHYEHAEIGYNYRLSNVLAALGSAQLQRLDGMIERRRKVRSAYDEVFASVDGVSLFQREGDDGDNCWLTAAVIDSDITGWRPQHLAEALAKRDVETRPLWKPMHTQPVYRNHRAFVTGASEGLFRSGLTLPSGSAMTDDDAGLVRETIARFIEETS